MVNIDSTLAYIETIRSSLLSGADEREVERRIVPVRKKRRDPRLYLAVIGEFSSGKSTFINALLGIRLLKEAVMPTTACATYIEGHAPEMSLRVSFFNGPEFCADEKDWEALRSYLFFNYRKECPDFREMIAVLTSDQEVARKVRSLNIKVPGTSIPRNIVIIDTPGFNPGSESVDNHHEITRHVVENIADAAIILTSQEQAMSATLSRFLNRNLSRCLHRCIYVVTKFDTLDDPAARAEVLEYARSRIIRDLNLPNPKLYGISAVTMLPVKRIPFGKEEEWPVLKEDFIRFMEQTWDTLRRSKDYVLSEHLYNLVKDVATLCVEKLDRKQKDLRADLRFLETHRVAAIRTVSDQMVESARKEISSASGNVTISFLSAETEAKNRASGIINSGIMSLAAFNNTMMPKIKNAVEDEAQKALAALNEAVNDKIGKSVRIHIGRMKDVFSSHYSGFPSLRPSERPPKVDLVKFKNPDLNFDIALSKIQALDQKENKTAGGGAAAGAGAGFLLGGPVGALVGAAIGMFVGIGAGNQSDAMKASTLPLVENEIGAFFTSLKMKVDNEMGLLRERYDHMLNSFASQHVATYGKAVENLIREHEGKIAALNTQIRSLRNAINGLKDVSDDLEQELALLRIR